MDGSTHALSRRAINQGGRVGDDKGKEGGLAVYQHDEIWGRDAFCGDSGSGVSFGAAPRVLPCAHNDGRAL